MLSAMRNSPFDQKGLLFRFRQHILSRKFFEGRKHILIACSGGGDSVALFHLLRVTLPAQSHKLALIHFNHGIRAGASKKDEIFVKKMAQKYKIPFFVGRAQLSKKSERIKLSLEEAARAKRYAFFKKIYNEQKSNAIVFAHHLDDQAETVLMRVCQGTGLRGLLGIRETMQMQKMDVIRPLLPFSKKELLIFLKQNKFLFCNDETNQKSIYLRNRIRREVLPYLAKKINPRILQALARIPETLGAENDLIEELEKKAAAKVILSISNKKICINAKAFNQLHAVLQFRILDNCLKKLNPAAGLLFENWKALKNQLLSLKPVSLPRGMEMTASPDKKELWIKEQTN